MATTKPYFIRAIHEWCSDEGLTPYLAVRVDAHTRVPREFVRDGQIVLNISSDATQKLSLGNDEVSFQARFNGVSFPVFVPVEAVIAVYARENGQGMAFEPDSSLANTDMAGDVGIAPAGEQSPEGISGREGAAAKRGSHLTRIK